MLNRTRAGYAGISLLLVVLILPSSYSIAQEQCGSQTLSGIKALVFAHGEETIIARAAIDAIHNGNTDTAITILEGQMATDLAVAHILQTKLVAQKALTPKEQETLDNIIKEGTAYADEHKLVIPKAQPSG